MSNALLTIVAAIYLWVAMEYHVNGNAGMALAFAAYAAANAGFIWANIK